MRCVSPRAGQRNCHNDEAGYICQRPHPYLAGVHVVIYESAQQGLDTSGGRYSVVCEAHGAICATQNLSDARALLKSVEFCEDCMDGTY